MDRQNHLEKLKIQSEGIWQAPSIFGSIEAFIQALRSEIDVQFCSYFQLMSTTSPIRLEHFNFTGVDQLPPDFVDDVLKPEILALQSQGKIKPNTTRKINIENQAPIYCAQFGENHILTWMTVGKPTEINSELQPNHLFLSSQLSNKIHLLEKIEFNKELAYRDELTGLYNYRYFWSIINNEIQRFDRTKKCFTIMFVDLDGFKQVNDQHGHLKGDEVLREFGSILQKCVRNVDMVARYGGDEFVLLLYEADLASGEIVRSRIQNFLKHRNSQQTNNKPTIHCSIGMAEFPLHGKNEQELLKYADKQTYQSKRKRSHDH